MTRTFNVPLGAALLSAVLLSACGNDYSLIGGTGRTDSTAVDARVLGTCFMHGDSCLSTYIDLGPYEHEPPLEKAAVPVYIFPSVPSVAGGAPNPFDPDGLYNPFRLQNNVFAGDGRVWEMWLVYSADLNLIATPQQGVTLHGIGADAGADRVRDLFLDPIRGEEELFDLVKAGDVRVEVTGVTTDCPITRPVGGDIVINLNPRFPLCPSP